MLFLVLTYLKQTTIINPTKGITEVRTMTIQKLKALTEHLPADTIVLIDLPDRTSDVETINIQYHTDGRAHLILSNKE